VAAVQYDDKARIQELRDAIDEYRVLRKNKIT
jgi:hypothetical protein